MSKEAILKLSTLVESLAWRLLMASLSNSMESKEGVEDSKAKITSVQQEELNIPKVNQADMNFKVLLINLWFMIKQDNFSSKMIKIMDIKDKTFVWKIVIKDWVHPLKDAIKGVVILDLMREAVVENTIGII